MLQNSTTVNIHLNFRDSDQIPTNFQLHSFHNASALKSNNILQSIFYILCNHLKPSSGSLLDLILIASVTISAFYSLKMQGNIGMKEHLQQI